MPGDDLDRVEITVREHAHELLSGLLTEEECRRVLISAVDVAGAPSDATVSLILSDDAELAMLNEAHMGKSGPTDVLSFPLMPPGLFPEHPGLDQAGRAEVDDFPLPPGEAIHLGDIIVSVERAIEQANAGTGGQTSDVRWAPADELRLLITHGGLHLCGWDHADPVEEAAMRALEHRLLGLIPA